MESAEEGTTEVSGWGKGLSRQSSLPSRRGEHSRANQGRVADAMLLLPLCRL